MPLKVIILVVSITILSMVAITFMEFPRELNLDKNQALVDISRGRVNLIKFGFAGRTMAEKQIGLKYGLVELNMGCMVGYTAGEKEYEKLISEFLIARNGKGWEVRYYHEIDSIRKILQINNDYRNLPISKSRN